MKMGLQLYTVKEDCDRDIRSVLSAVADMGYDGIEYGGTYGLNIEEYRDLLLKLGLETAGVMRSADQLEADFGDAAALARAVNTSTILIPGLWGPRFTGSAAAFKEGARFMNEMGMKCKDEGFGFQYHIHGQEFEIVDGDGSQAVTGLEIMISETDPETVRFELDTYWVDWAKGDALALARKLGKRLGYFHIKDYRSRDDMFDVEAGAGALDVSALIEIGQAAGVEWAVVEQEQFDKPPMDAAAISAKNLRAVMGRG